jgi:hypothetical protein
VASILIELTSSDRLLQVNKLQPDRLVAPLETMHEHPKIGRYRRDLCQQRPGAGALFGL